MSLNFSNCFFQLACLNRDAIEGGMLRLVVLSLKVSLHLEQLPCSHQSKNLRTKQDQLEKTNRYPILLT